MDRLTEAWEKPRYLQTNADQMYMTLALLAAIALLIGLFFGAYGVSVLWNKGRAALADRKRRRNR